MLNIDPEICAKCPLQDLHRTPVPGVGPEDSNIMFLGEAPGATEDKEGKPFVGRSGAFLTQLLSLTGFDRDKLYITNTVKCRPEDNATPTPEIRAACKSYLEAEIARVKPKVIVCVGYSALKGIWEVLGVEDMLAVKPERKLKIYEKPKDKPKKPKVKKFTDVRGKWFVYPNYYVLPIYHPSFLLRKHTVTPDSPRGLTRFDLSCLYVLNQYLPRLSENKDDVSQAIEKLLVLEKAATILPDFMPILHGITTQVYKLLQ